MGAPGRTATVGCGAFDATEAPQLLDQPHPTKCPRAGPELRTLGRDLKPVGGDVSEMRVDFGPGYRLYFTRKGSVLIVMLAGGDKSTQARDIRRAQRILNQLELEP